MPRRPSAGHYLTRPGRSTRPAAVVSVVVLPRESDSQIRSGWTEHTFGSAFVCASRWSGKHWTRPEEHAFHGAESFWTWLDRWCQRRRRTWVVAPIASDSLTLLDAWNRFARLGCRWEKGRPSPGAAGNAEPAGVRVIVDKLVTRGVPDIVSYRDAGRSITWVSMRQYFPDGHAAAPANLRPSVGGTKSCPPNDTPNRSAGGTRSHEQWQALARICDSWAALGAGPWRPTAAALGWSYFRSRVPVGKVCSHRHPKVIDLERSACHGGRAAVWCYAPVVVPLSTYSGRYPPPSLPPYPHVEVPVCNVDVRSMHAHMLQSKEYPGKLLTYREGPSVGNVRDWLTSVCVIARVRVMPSVHDYPHRGTTGITYPGRSHTTTLAGPELLRAIEAGEIQQVYAASLYTRGPWWRGAAEGLIRMRKEARAGTPGYSEALAKMLANAAAGKMAQRPAHWVDCPNKSPARMFGEWLERDVGAGETHRYRSVMGLVQRWDRSPPTTGGLPASFAYLTSYVRVFMDALRARCRERSVVSQDTDGVWVTLDGLNDLKDTVLDAGEDAGQLRVGPHVDRAVWFGPRHYWVDGNWVLSGFGGYEATVGTLELTYRHRHNPVREGWDGRGDALTVIESTVGNIQPRQDVPPGPDGWVVRPAG